jgi:integrase
MNVADFADRWPRRFPRPDPHTNATRASMIRCFAKHFANRELGDISRADAFKWASANPSAARYARSMYADAVNAGVVEVNPFAGLRILNGQSVGRAYEELPSAEQIARLEEAAPACIAGAITFAAFTGLRLGEQLGVRGSDIAGDVLGLATQLNAAGKRKPLKGKAPPRKVYLCPEALEAVSGLLSAGDGRLWPISRSMHFKAWSATREAVGVGFAWHLLRHVGATRLVELGASTRDVAYMLGHANDDQVRRLYARHVDDDGALARLREVA